MKKNNSHKLIIVLGMHRSGTSAITRGLKTLGVDLGTNLMPGAEGDNPKGYWEDMDIFQLNVEMQEFLKTDWFSLTPTQSEDVDILRRNGYLLRAVELLRRKTADAAIFGFKDPRVAKLLPFWKEVFTHDQLKTYYILAVRHPLSVCKSLAKRSGFDFEKSYMLWLEHVISSVAGTDGENRVVVDYDCLLNSPETEISRIANEFELDINETELQKFKDEFLDKDLRHTVYRINDLTLDKTASPLVAEVYSRVLDVATNQLSMGDTVFKNSVKRWSKELSRMKSLLILNDKLESRLTEREQAVQTLNSQLVEREQAVQTLNSQLVEREQAVQTLNSQLVEREQAVQTLNSQLVEREQAVQTLNSQLVEREQAIQSLTTQANEHEQTAQRLTNQMAKQEQAVQTLTQELSHQAVKQDMLVQTLNKQLTEQTVQREQAVQSLTAQVAEREQMIQALYKQVMEISGSKKWKFALLLSRIRMALAPENSFRFRVLRSLYRFTIPSIKSLRKPSSSASATAISAPEKINVTETPKMDVIEPIPEVTKSNDNNLDGLIQDRFPNLRPLLGFRVPESGVRLNMVTDSINSGSLFGGVGTAINLSALLAKKWGCDLRLITRHEPAKRENFKKILDLNEVPCPENVEFVWAYVFDPNAEIPVKDGDIFLTTSWWTTWSVRETFGNKKIIYLIQEDERTFYPFGDDRFRCSDILNDPNILYIVNSKLLYDHFVADGLTSIHKNGLWFEPSFPKNLFYFEKKQDQSKKNFFFYARPNNVRNLYSLGLEVINTAVTKGILDPNEWNFYFVGKDLPEERLRTFYKSITAQNLGWYEYSALVRKIDLGLSLMYSVHPSYPPLDLAASGSVVVTNTYGLKQNLDQYSKNIICRDLTVRDLVDGIKCGVELAANIDVRRQNYEENGLKRDWQTSFEEILQKLDKGMFNVSH